MQLSVADLFVAPTIEKLAQKIATQKTLGSPSPAIYSHQLESSPSLKVPPALLASRPSAARARTPPLSSLRMTAQSALTSASRAPHSQVASDVDSFPGGGRVPSSRRGAAEEMRDEEADSLFSWDYAPSLSNTSLVRDSDPSQFVVSDSAVLRVVCWCKSFLWL